jgi:hypothetical protein
LSSPSFSFSLCLFQASEFLFTYGSLSHLVGLLGRGISSAPRPLPTQGTTTQRNTDTHPYPEQGSNLRSQCSSGRRQYLLPLLLGPNILLSTLLPNTLNLCCSLCVRDQISLP